MAAHFSYRKIQILSKIGRREEACEERDRFIRGKLFFRLGIPKEDSISKYFLQTSRQVQDLCVMGRFNEARTLTEGFPNEFLNTIAFVVRLTIFFANLTCFIPISKA